MSNDISKSMTTLPAPRVNWTLAVCISSVLLLVITILLFGYIDVIERQPDGSGKGAGILFVLWLFALPVVGTALTGFIAMLNYIWRKLTS